jgi:hypothetical protein
MAKSISKAILAGSLIASAAANGSVLEPAKGSTPIIPAVEIEQQHPIDGMLQAEEREFRTAILRAVDDADPVRSIEKIDALIPLLGRNSPTQIFLRTQKARRTVESGSVELGAAAFQTLLKRYPHIIPIKLIAIHSLGYTTAADISARNWIELAARHPQAARAVDGYTLGAVATNLEAKAQIDVRDALLLALDNIGYDPGSTILRDQMQIAIFLNAAADRGREAEAHAALGKISNPAELVEIAAQQKYNDYWKSIATDPASLETKAQSYLSALRADFVKAENGQVAGAYLSASRSYTDPVTVTSAYAPVLDRLIGQSGQGGYDTFDAQFWVAPLAWAWTESGSQERAEALFESALPAFDDTHGITRLNISANYALHLLDDDRPSEALAFIEPAIAELEAADSSLTALSQMHAVRLRAYHELGRPERAFASRRNLESHRASLLSIYSDAMLAIGDDSAARDAIISVLRSRDPRAAISYLQAPLQPLRLPRHVVHETAKDRLRQDPAIKSALLSVGRIVEVSPIRLADFDHSGAAEEFLTRLN